MKKNVLITGATDGIGRETAFLAASKDFNLVLHGRNDERLQSVSNEISSNFPSIEVKTLSADFCDLAETARVFKEFAQREGMPQVLINNAGVLMREKIITDDGFEESWQVNHLAPFLLTKILLEKMDNKVRYRIINVSSMIHANELDFDNLNAEKYFSSHESYALAKLCNILFTNKLTRKFAPEHLLAASVHPGVINTKLLRQQWGGGADPAEGAANVFFAVEFEGLSAIPAAYIENRRPMQAADVAYSEEVQDKLWNKSLEVLSKYV